MNTNSNVYTIVYAIIIVVIVAVLLAVANQVLRPAQQANEELDRQKQILVALNQEIGSNPAALYRSLVTDTIMVNDMPVYIATVNGETKHVLLLKGAGLWGPIGGYLALNDDLNTIFGINFNHESETPGLGGEIVTAKFREPFAGKHIRNAQGEIVSVAVLKKGNQADGQEQVDALSGATITSTGVSDMLKTNLMQYESYLKQPLEEVQQEDTVEETAIVEPSNVE